MGDTSSSPIRTHSAHFGADRVTQRRAFLADEARRLSRRRTVALAVAARCRKIADVAIQPEAAQTVSSRAMRRASTLHIRFHQTLDALVSAGGFDEAMTIVRDRRRPTH